MRRGRKLLLLAAAFWCFFLGGEAVMGMEEGQERESQREESFFDSGLLEDMELDEAQKAVDELLGEETFGIREAVQKLINGEEVLSKESVAGLLREIFFAQLQKERSLFLKILLLVLIAAIFSNFAEIFENGQIAEVSFYIVYLVLFILLVESFASLSQSLEEALTWMTRFMQGLAPAYFLAVAASSGTATAAVFYQGALLLVWLIQWILLTILLPGVNLYVMLRLVNHLSKEEMLGKLAELLKTLIGWGLKTLLGLVVGMQVVKGLVAPVIDSLKRSAIGKTAGAIPGVGNALNAVTELVVTSAVLVRNCLGVSFVIVLLLAGLSPILKYGMMSFAYRLLAAVAQPVSDKRMIGCLGTMGEGCSMLLRVMLTAEVLSMVTIAILAVSFGGGG